MLVKLSKIVLFLLCCTTLLFSSCKNKSTDIPYTFEELAGIQGKNRLLIKQHGLYGYTNMDSNVVIAPQYDSALFFNTNPYTLVQKEGLWGIIDQSGKKVVDCIYDSILAYNGIDFENYPIVVKNEQYSIVDTTGRVLAKNYKFLKRTFQYNLFIAKKGKGYGLIDPKGNWHTSEDYNQYKTHLGWSILKKDDQWKLFNTQGKALFNDKTFDSISIEPRPYYNLVAGRRYLVKQNSWWGVINDQGEWAIPNSYKTIQFMEQESEFILTPAQ